MLNKKLLALALGGFSIGMTEFAMMGLLPDIAQDLQIDIPTAGHLIAIYALGVVVGAPLLVMFTGKMAPKKVLVFMMLIFTVGHLLFILSPSYPILLITRFLSGLPHGAFFGVGSVVASRIAPKGKEAQSIALMFTGLTIANLIGVPLGTYLGHLFDWRLTYAAISITGIITMLALNKWIPDLPAQDNGAPISEQLGFFKRWQGIVLTLMIAIGTGGLFSWISYIAPLMTDIAKVAPEHVSYVMILVGLGMFFGNLIGGKIADSVTPTKAAITSFLLMALCLGLVYLFSYNTTIALILTFMTGLVSFTVGSPIQLMLINSAKESERMIAAASGQASFNIGNALGAFLGGIPISYGWGYNSPELVGIVMALIGALLATVFLVLTSRQSKNNSVRITSNAVAIH
jgi:DHA1 family arabinose polymer transporter-like MFS transporter